MPKQYNSHTSNGEYSLTLFAPAVNSIDSPPYQCNVSAHTLSMKTIDLFTFWHILSATALPQACTSIEVIVNQGFIKKNPILVVSPTKQHKKYIVKKL